MDIIERPAAIIRNIDGLQTGTIHVVRWGVEYGFPLWSQRDPRWSGDKLGTCIWTMGQRGCLVTDAAMGITKAIGAEVTPGRLNAQLKDVGGYVYGCDLVFNRIAKLYPSIQFIELVRYPKTLAPAADIARWVAQGDIVIVLIDMDVSDPDVDQHWVLIVGGDESVLKIHDPWPMPDNQQQLLLPPAYCRQDWNPARAIYAHVRYGVVK